MKNRNDIERIHDALNDLLDWQDPVQDKPLSHTSAAREELVHSSLYRANCFLRQLIARNFTADMAPFFLTAEQRGQLVPASVPVRETVLLRQINRAAEGNACRPLTGAELSAWMVEQDLYLPFPEDYEVYILSQEGEDVGMYYDETGEFPVLYYNPSAQQYLFDHLEDLMQHIQSRALRIPLLTVHPKLLPATLQEMEQLSRGCHPETGEALSQEDPLCQEGLRAIFAQTAEVLRHAAENGHFPV